MRKLRIPDYHIDIIKSLIQNNQLFRDLIDVFNSVDVNISDDNLEKTIADKSGITSKKSQDLVELFIALLFSKESAKLDASAFHEDVIETLEAKKVKPDENFKTNLLEFLKLDKSPFHLKVRSKRLLYEREKLLLDCNIYTDVRHIFDEACDDILGSLILHTFKIEYNENREVKEIYIAIDNDDVQKLKQIISRVEEKEKLVRKKLKETDTLILEG